MYVYYRYGPARYQGTFIWIEFVEAVTMDPDVSDTLDTYLDLAIDEGLRKAAPGPTVDITAHLTDAHTESFEAYSLESIEALDQKLDRDRRT